MESPPIPTKIKLAEKDSLTVLWSDGHASSYPHRFLRDKCPCATCTDSGHRAAATASQFPMFAKAVRPERAELVGRYAVQIYWSDGHSSGIYSFRYLRDLCPCAVCAAPREASDDDRQSTSGRT